MLGLAVAIPRQAGPDRRAEVDCHAQPPGIDGGHRAPLADEVQRRPILALRRKIRQPQRLLAFQMPVIIMGDYALYNTFRHIVISGPLCANRF